MLWRSPHRIIVEIYLLCTGGYYARLICSVTPVVQGSYPGVSNWMSYSLSSRRVLLWGCLWMTLVGTVSPVGEQRMWEVYSGNSGDVWGCMRMVLTCMVESLRVYLLSWSWLLGWRVSCVHWVAGSLSYAPF